ncbi:ATPase domain-containing protein [Candidatus Nitrosotalea bavarica]|uniref:ATPase domain-containing protein n=1 Tax=Candidatus Nitrosotalea bavarica TaxID=1903277 RepID=UPI001FEC5784|nr:ATPase domain-containing protein [Candidatus Nitrosotalea bavarica]
MDEVITVRTGIPGFDTILSGGFRQGKSITLSGPPGSGKTTFGMQFLYSGAKDFDEPGIFVTLSQSPTEIKNDFKSLGWDIQKLIDEGQMIIIDARPFKKKEGFIALDESLYQGEPLPFMHLTQLILSSIKRIGAKRIVIDSLTVLAMQYVNNFYIRQGLQGLVYALEDQHCMSILISEIDSSEKSPVEWYVSSGVILLCHVRKEYSMERTIQVLKMRGAKHSEQIFPIKLNEMGIQIMYPQMIK